jgi:hypothetical protein
MQLRVNLSIIFLFLCSFGHGRKEEHHPVKIAKSKENCGLRKAQIPIAIHGCKITLASIATCGGTCLSFEIPLHHLWNEYKLVTVLTCCKVHEYDDIHVELECLDNNGEDVYKMHDIRVAKSCLCRRCGITDRHH